MLDIEHPPVEAVTSLIVHDQGRDHRQAPHPRLASRLDDPAQAVSLRMRFVPLPTDGVRQVKIDALPPRYGFPQRRDVEEIRLYDPRCSEIRRPGRVASGDGDFVSRRHELARDGTPKRSGRTDDRNAFDR